MKFNGRDYQEGSLSQAFSSQILNDLENALEAGFQQAVQQGPLCGEPLYGLIIELLELDLSVEEHTPIESKHYC